MVSIDKIEQGMALYLDEELMPQLQKDGVERVLVGTAASLLIRRLGTVAEEYRDSRFVKILGIMDESGDVDVDVLVEEVKKNISKEGFTIDVPVLGAMTFHKEDVDKLYTCIKEV